MSDEQRPYFYSRLVKTVAEAMAEAPLELFSEEQQEEYKEKANRLLFASVPILFEEMAKDSLNTAVAEVYNGRVETAVALYKIGDFLSRMGQSISDEGLNLSAGLDE